MEQNAGAHTLEQRDIVATLDREFARLHLRLTAIIESTPAALLYECLAQQPFKEIHSIGENVLRSAAAIEQTFGGLSANLWDDPFEWTLPEQLSTPATVLAHLAEVEEIREHAFRSFTDDSCLLKSIATPANGLVSLMELLLRTLLRAAHYQSRAAVMLKALSGISPSGLII
ncbi:MAG TPA: hypothetical protein VHR36_14050 [Pyrinomonadaceae bacterium]|jgi:hypothetical protein|nr:hypothetical protein [Pyrinomonadaceae bacterium]